MSKQYGVIYGQTTDYGELSVAMRTTDERGSDVRENISVWAQKSRCLGNWENLGLHGMTFEEADELVKKLERYVHIEKTGQKLAYMPGLHDIQMITWYA